MFGPIEQMMSEEIAPFVGNTHTETSVTGTTMTRAYHEALHIIKDHVHASADDAIICYGTGRTCAASTSCSTSSGSAWPPFPACTSSPASTATGSGSFRSTSTTCITTLPCAC